MTTPPRHITITTAAMAEYFAKPDHRSLWISAAFEPDPKGSATVWRPVASVVADDAHPGEFVITYADTVRDCRTAVRAAGERRFAVVDTHRLSTPDGELVAELPVGAECLWFYGCQQPATQLRKHPVRTFVPACDRCATRGIVVGS